MSQLIIKISKAKRNSRVAVFLACLAAALLPACSPDGSLIGTDPPPVPPEDLARFLLFRNARWPGGGRELTVGVLNEATLRAFEDDMSSRLVLQIAGGGTVRTAAKRVLLGPGYTAVLLPASQTAAERAITAQAVLRFAAGRPSGEKVALYRHGANVQLFSNFLAEPTKLAEALDRYQNGVDSDPAPMNLLQAASTAASDVHEVSGAGPDVMRSLVVLNKDPRVVFTNYPQAYVIAVTPDDAGLSAASAAIEFVRQSAFYKLTACGDEAKLSSILKLNKVQGDLAVTLPATLPEETGVSCSPEALDSRQRTFSPRIEFVFDATQKAAHDARIKAAEVSPYNDTLAVSDFQTQVRLAPGQPTILATAHLRGRSSLRCPRHSYTLQLEGPERYLLPDSASDEYLLISMCDDSAYVYAPSVYTLLSGDLFPSKFRFVEFILDGKTRGIYMLMEKTREELVRDSARARSVMRRQYPSGNLESFEVLWSDDDNLASPAARYQQFMTSISALTGDALVAALRNQLDLDQYLRYLASQSIFRSGDYIDELFLSGTEQADGRGGIGETYRFMAWDPEGYTNCHGGGALAYVDANNMAYCAEARLDHKILADPKVYGLFVSRIETAMSTTLTRERMLAGVTEIKNAIQSWLTVPEICAAMTELQRINAGAADCAIARTVIQQRADAIMAGYDARRTYLQMQVAAYRVKYP
jgi:hypothetical protein